MVTGNVRKARLRAIVVVDYEHRVQCQQPHCGHSVWAAVHVVEEDGKLLVLGSDCFKRRYGNASALGEPQYGGSGGRKLADEERRLLESNTAVLLARFEAELQAQRAHIAAAQPVDAAPEQMTQFEHARFSEPPRYKSAPAVSMKPRSSPWPWQMPGTSVALVEAADGRRLVRVQHVDSSQKLVPWPGFPGWATLLPVSLATPDMELGLLHIAAGRIADALLHLQHVGFGKPMPGRWDTVLGTRPRR